MESSPRQVGAANRKRACVEAKCATIPTLTLLDEESNLDEPEEVDEATLPLFATPSSS
jgi:hypothetical protein